MVANGQYGSLTIKSDGSYTYAMKGEGENVSFEIDGKTYTSLDQLAEGDTIHETFTIYVRDEHNAWTSQTVTVTIHGTNDIPTLEIKGEDWNITQGASCPSAAHSRSATTTATPGKTRPSASKAARPRTPTARNMTPSARLPRVPTPPKAARRPRSRRNTAR